MSPLLFALSVQVSTKEFIFRYDGKESGSSVYREFGNGKAESLTEIDLAGYHVSSKLSIQSSDDKVTQFEFDEKMLAGTKEVQVSSIRFEDGKATFTTKRGGTPTVAPIEPTLPIFANFHPGLLKKLDLSGISKLTLKKMFMLESLSKAGFTFDSPLSRQITRDGKSMEASVYPMKVVTVQGSAAFDKSGEFLGWNIPSQKIGFELKGTGGLFVDPIAKYPELSQASMETTTAEVDIPMRDGVTTKATVYRPKAEGRYPVILTRTPYGRKQSPTANFFASRGYVFVSQDVRGTGDSKGVFLPMESERADGYDTIDWIDNQVWCNGRVGMIGASYGGFVQWAAAVENHPSLKCMVPQVSPPGSAMWNLPYDAGTLLLMSDLWWMRIVDNPNGNGALGAMDTMKNLRALNILPLNKIDDKLLGFNSKIYDRWLTKEGSKSWPTVDFENLIGKVEIPVLHISGWFDGDEIGTQRNWMFGRSAGKKNQWLIYGPWNHFFNTTSSLQDVNFGDHAILELDSLYLRWFDTWLKEKQVGIEKVPKAKFFVTGKNQWIETSDWPMSGSTTQSLQFDFASGKMVSKVSKPSSKTYIYDPSTTKFEIDTLDIGSQAGSMFASKKTLALAPIYLESEPMKEDTTITGPMSVEFDFKSDAKDTDFFAEVWDMDANNKAYPAFRGGKLRAAYVNGMDQPRALLAGKTYRAKLMMWDAAHLVKKGHRLAFRLKSENFPAAARNLGGMEPLATAIKIFKQRNTLMSSPSSPAVFKFQILPAGAVK
ncbi:MAG: CocE/NonD family hydrolase [Armatimonadota bacterium]